MRPIQSIVIGTAGHIDHGKTALVRALTGIDTDRLPEEKRRGITIDLGFAPMDTDAPDGSRFRVSFVDVPGHALFIRNMLAGAGCVPAVMLVVAADEGVMPQTREHLAICELLGISNGFTAISKADLVSESQLQEVRHDISRFLQGTFLGTRDNAILPVSAHSGRGLASVRAELIKLAMGVRGVDRAHPTRLPIDRTFIKKGFGTVITGTLLSGEIRVGQTLALEPGARSVRVRGLQTHGESEAVAEAGSRVAVNLSGVNASEISRGQTLVVAGELASVDAIDVEVKLLEDAPPLKHRARVHFHAFTSETMAHVSLYGNEHVKPGSTRVMRLRLAKAIVLAPGDRFVLRQPLPAGTIGGGRVLDAHPIERQRRSETLALLQQFVGASPEQALVLRVRRRGQDGIQLVELAREIGLGVETIAKHAEPLLQRGELRLVGNKLLLAPETFTGASDIILSRIKEAEASGLKRSELRSQTGMGPEILDAVLDRLVAEHTIQLRGEVITIASFAAEPFAKDARHIQAVNAAYRAAGLAPPSVRELAQHLRIAELEMRRVVTLLLRDKSLVRMGSDDVFVHAKAIEQLVSRLTSYRGGCIDVPEFKAMTGLSRKHAIPLLEYLDRARITRKQGNQRLVL